MEEKARQRPDGPQSPLWSKALERYRGELEDDEDGYHTLLEAGTLQEVIDHIDTLRPPSAGEKAVVNRLGPVLKYINDFSAVVAVCFGADAKLTALVWGSLRMILTLASEKGQNLRDIVDLLEELSLTLPRFQAYEKTLPMNEAFESAILNVYTEVICFYARTIHFYRKHPHDLLRRNAWTDFLGDFSKTIQRIKRLSSLVESEADAARMRLDKANYTEVLDLIKQMVDNKISTDEKHCYIVPYQPHPRFTGREETLHQIGQILATEEVRNGQRSLALWGMGGVGKTQIALQYASSSRPYFDIIMWVSADSAIQVSQSFREIAVLLGLQHANEQDVMSATSKVKAWLFNSNQPWLLILDNADDPDILRLAWPQGETGSILVTSRNPSLAITQSSEILEVQPLDDSEGSLALLKFANLDPQSSTNLSISKEIAHVLGGLPLALNQIGGFIHQRRLPLKDFLPLYQRNASKIDAKSAGISGYEHSLSTVWELSLKRLPKPARNLLELFAFLDPDRIDAAVLSEATVASNRELPDLDFLTDEMDLLDAEDSLIQSSLINKTSENGLISVHRLVQSAVMRKLSIQDKTQYFEVVVGILSRSFPQTWTEDLGHQHHNWKKCESCLPHVDHLVKQKHQYKVELADSQAFAELLLRCCWYLYERERYDIARTFVNEALKNFNDRESLAFASAVELSGLIDMDLNIQNEALESFSRAFDIRNKLLDPDDSLIAASLTTLGIVHTELGNLDTAYGYHDKARDIRFRTKSERIGNSYSNISSLLLRMGRADEAEDLLKRCPALKDFTDETFLKTGNPRFSGDMVLLARIRVAQGRHDEALRLASKALQFRQNLLGNRLKTCDSLYQVADLLHKRNNLPSAIDLLSDCVTISENLSEGEGQLARANWPGHTSNYRCCFHSKEGMTGVRYTGSKLGH